MTTTPRLGITQWEEGQAMPESTGNEGWRYLEQGAGFFIVADKDLTSPPGSPADGDAYIVGGSATGAWSGHDDDIAFYLNTAWAFITPIEGTRADVNDEDVTYRYSGSAWAISLASVANETIDDRVAALLVAGTGITLTYNDGANTLTIDGGSSYTDEQAMDAVAAMLTAGTGIGLSYNDASNTFTITNTAPSAGTYTDENARDAIGAALVAGAGVGITVDDAGDTITIKATDYRIGFFFTTTPTVSEVIALHVVTDAFTFPANFASPNSQGSCGTNPAASFALDVQKNGTTIGTITISTGGAFTFATASGTSKSIVAGDVIKVVAPSPADTTCANVAITLKGTI